MRRGYGNTTTTTNTTRATTGRQTPPIAHGVFFQLDAPIILELQSITRAYPYGVSYYYVLWTTAIDQHQTVQPCWKHIVWLMFHLRSLLLPPAQEMPGTNSLTLLTKMEASATGDTKHLVITITTIGLTQLWGRHGVTPPKYYTRTADDCLVSALANPRRPDPHRAQRSTRGSR